MSQHFLIGTLYYVDDAIGLGQGEVYVAEPSLRKQVQNFAAHGMVGRFFQDQDQRP